MAFTKQEFLDWLITPIIHNGSEKSLRNILSYYGYWMLTINSKLIAKRFEINSSRVSQINKEFEKKLKHPKIIGNFINKTFIDNEIPEQFKNHYGVIFFIYTSFGKDLSIIFDKFWLENYSIDKIKELLLKYQYENDYV